MATTARDGATTGISAWLVRGMLLVAAMFLFRWAQSAFADYERVSLAQLRYDPPGFIGAMGLFVLAGLAFGLAIRYPFPDARFAWTRLAFAAVALIPAAHLWYLLTGSGEGLLARPYWFDEFAIVQIGSVLAGVSIASGVGARR